MRGLATLGIGLALTAPPSTLHAQRAHEYEVGAFGAYTRYDRAFNLPNKVGGGARLGYFLTSVVGLEIDVLFQPEYAVTGTTATMQPLIGSGSLVLNLATGSRNIFYVLGGYSRLDFGATAPYRFSDHAVHGAVGDRLFFSERVALRVEGRGIYAPQTEASFGPVWAGHIVGSAGLSVFHQGGPRRPPRPPRDTDQDGVPDKRDRCPGTPVGATVDARGCPVDSDKDAVFDGLDKCAATPVGATVDATGCPLDADADRVFDGLDKCANTPAGAAVDATGCPLDGDKDGVFDGLDKCPTTAAGATVDATGCPLDGDKDGVLDGLDKCPNTPAGATVDATGCPLDGDKDGVFDGLDRCPNTPAGVQVDVAGCPLVKDTDHDSVDDSRDRCPGTAPGIRVDAAGCPILFIEGRERTPVVLRGVTFQTGRSALRPESYAVLDIVAASLQANPEIRIEIAGHTDNTGSMALNLRLSQARAAAVRAYLAGKGVSPARMVARGLGPTRPIATNTTAAGRAQNRRVELRKLP